MKSEDARRKSLDKLIHCFYPLCNRGAGESEDCGRLTYHHEKAESKRKGVDGI